MEIKIEPITETDKSRVIEFLTAHFLTDEPLNASLRLEASPEFTHFCLCTIDEGFSYMATDPLAGLVLGVFIVGTVQRDTESSAVCYKNDEKFNKIMQLTSELDRRLDLFNAYPCLSSYAEGRILCVSRHCRGQGIASQLIEPAIEKLHAASVPLIVVHCSGSQSSRVMEKMGFGRPVITLPYADFLVDGVQVLQPGPPHNQAAVYMKQFKCDDAILKN